MNTVRLNIAIPAALNDDITRYYQELNEKKESFDIFCAW